MKGFQLVSNINEYIQGSSPSLLNSCGQLTFWMGHIQEDPILSITINETETDFVLKVCISDIHLVKLDVQITPETILIQGQPTEAAGVEGYFRPKDFNSLIPLPHPIQPEISLAEMQPDGLILQLAKQLGNQQPKVRIQLPIANVVFSQQPA